LVGCIDVFYFTCPTTLAPAQGNGNLKVQATFDGSEIDNLELIPNPGIIRRTHAQQTTTTDD
jgi:hypothetical protein